MITIDVHFGDIFSDIIIKHSTILYNKGYPIFQSKNDFIKLYNCTTGSDQIRDNAIIGYFSIYNTPETSFLNSLIFINEKFCYDITPQPTDKITPHRTPKKSPQPTPKRTPQQTPQPTPKRTPQPTPKRSPQETPKITPVLTPLSTPLQTYPKTQNYREKCRKCNKRSRVYF